MRIFQLLLSAAVLIGGANLAGAAAAPGKRDQQGKSKRAGDRVSHVLMQHVAKKLTLENTTKIELSQLAAERTKSEEVKEFAHMMVKDHMALNDKLSDFTPTTDRPKQEPAKRKGGKKAGQHAVLDHLCVIYQQAGKNYLAMQKEMLKNYKGQDFDMAFLSGQVTSHVWMVAQLKALEGVGNEQFQQVITRATEETQQHLEHAKEFAKRLEDDRLKRSAKRPKSAVSE